MISLRLNNNFQVKTSAQLPVDWYTDSEIYALEIKHLFSKAPQYLGHELMVPNQGDFYTLSWMQDGKALVHDQQGINLVSNVCRHRQALMLKGQGNTKHIICPLHRWTYNLKGELLGAPHFEENPCLHLDHTPLTNWQGLLFKSKRNIAEDLIAVGCKQDFNFTDYILDRVTVDEYNFNWKTFIEVYLEDYHVGPFHPD
jgi:phenylpropionate dioxygenase-like ring-hydroxylating dioxygenase large terminal subunit